MSHKRTRRDFLRGRGGPTAETPQLQAKAAGRGYQVHVSRDAMACEFEVILNAGQYAAGAETALDALDLVDSIEDWMSVFRDDSQISRVNQQAASQPVAVDCELFDLFALCLDLHAATEGAFDVTSTPIWRVWGFAQRKGALPDPHDLAEAMARTGSGLIDLDARSNTVRFLREGVELNLGAIGKGYALDRAAAMLTASGIHDFLLHGGASSLLGVGSQSRPDVAAKTDSASGWPVGIVHPMRPTLRLAEIQLRDRALATSGCGAQFFRHQGRRYGHILDPRTGYPAQDVLSSTVLAPSAAEADALSTAFYVMGPEKAFAFREARPELALLMVLPTNHAPGFEVRHAGFSEGEPRMLACW